jgi:Domain of unknown function DUF222.
LVEKRTPDQQRHDLLAAMIRAAGAADADDVPTPAPLVIRIDADQVDRPGGTGTISGIEGRFFTAQQRRAVACRDGDTCVIPGCAAPFSSLEADHVEEHRKQGPTHVDNCVLLCWWHHHLIDTGVWVVGVWVVGVWVVEMVGGRPRIRVPIRSRLRMVA